MTLLNDDKTNSLTLEVLQLLVVNRPCSPSRDTPFAAIACTLCIPASEHGDDRQSERQISICLNSA